jgi:hypothetical protein
MSDSTAAAAPLHHVFVDYENVPRVDAAIVGAPGVALTLLLGPKSTKLDAALVEQLLEHTGSVQLIRLAASGKNALDFALAYYVGRTANAHPGTHLHIVSKDQGFDPLVEHLRSRHLHARRHDDFTTLPFSKGPAPERPAPKAPPTPPEDPVARALDHLRRMPTNRPKKKKSLLSLLKSNLGQDASAADALALLEKLLKAGHLGIGDKDVVTYHSRSFPPA